MTFITSLINILGEMAPYILLGFIIAGLLHEFVRPTTMASQLSRPGWKSSLKAAALGVPLPLCSCGVLPTAIGLHRQGASKGATTSFLISTPQTGVDSIAATYSLLGLPIAVLRPVAALLGGVFGGVWAGKHEKASNVMANCNTSIQAQKKSFVNKLFGALKYGLVDMVASVGKWLIIGLVIAAVITAFLPEDVLVWLNRWPGLALVGAIIIAVPMYVCATGSIPIALSLMLKGLTPGVAFVFLMAGPAVNFASFTVLSRELGKRATLIYVATVVITAIFFGCLIDYLLPRDWFLPTSMVASHCGDCDGLGWFQITCAAILIAALVYTSLLSYVNRKKVKSTSNSMSKTFKINGMECNHCKMTVEKALTAIPGVSSVVADPSTGLVVVDGDISRDQARNAIEAVGFSLVDDDRG